MTYKISSYKIAIFLMYTTSLKFIEVVLLQVNLRVALSFYQAQLQFSCRCVL